jgi:hypothetical protein
MKRTVFAACACLAGASALGATIVAWNQGSASLREGGRLPGGIEPQSVAPAPAAGLPTVLGDAPDGGPSPEPRLSHAPPQVPSRVLPGPDPDEGKPPPPPLTAPSKTLPGPVNDEPQVQAVDPGANDSPPPP